MTEKLAGATTCDKHMCIYVGSPPKLTPIYSFKPEMLCFSMCDGYPVSSMSMHSMESFVLAPCSRSLFATTTSRQPYGPFAHE